MIAFPLALEASEWRAAAAAAEQRGPTGRQGHQVRLSTPLRVLVTRRTTRQIELDTTRFADLLGGVVCSGALSQTKNINVSGGGGRKEERKRKRKQASVANEKLSAFSPCEPTGRFHI